MSTWELKDTNENRITADKIARYYYAHFNFMGYRPTYHAIAMHFKRSVGWVGPYLNFARNIGLIRKEWTVKIKRKPPKEMQ